METQFLSFEAVHYTNIPEFIVQIKAAHAADSKMWKNMRDTRNAPGE